MNALRSALPDTPEVRIFNADYFMLARAKKIAELKLKLPPALLRRVIARLESLEQQLGLGDRL